MGSIVGLTEFFLIGGILLLASIVASKATGRLGVPALLIFLLIGMLAGSEGPGGIYFDDPALTQSLGVGALIFILFSGGLDTKWSYVRPARWGAISLATIGVALTALLVGWFANVVLGFSLLEGFLLGAIVSSTDAAAVFAILRSKGVGLRGQIKPLIELESGTNDPMAVFLTTAVISLLTVSGASALDLLPMFIRQMMLGALLGYLFGRVAVIVLNRVDLEYDGLYPVLTIALVLITYSATTLVRGNGFLAVFLAGLVLSNNHFIHKRSLLRFHDGLAWLMQIAMFLTLGLLVFPSRLLPIVGYGLLLSLFLILVARPAGVLISLLISRPSLRISLRDQTMVGWVGLRGAVPIILATFPLLAGIPAAATIFNLVFFIVLTSVLVQGTSIPLVARWLRVDEPLRVRQRSPLEFEPTQGIQGGLVELEIPPDSRMVGKQIVELGLPGGALFVLIGRDGGFVVPGGSSVLQAGDTILILADDESSEAVRQLLEVPAGPAAPGAGTAAGPPPGSDSDDKERSWT
jgi:potassium/hydrogen antiporter